MVSAFAIQSPFVGPFATDLTGNVIWYYQRLTAEPNSVLLRPTPAGTLMLLLPSVTPSDGGTVVGQVLREVDLASNIVRETNVAAINLQLKALGKDTVNWLSHDAVRLPNGHTLTFGSVERLYTNVQGPGTVDVVGDMILDLDQNFQVAWTWEAFDHLDVTRRATFNETCQSNIGCGPLYLAPTANDWTHGNSLRYMPDGSLLVSIRNQDWVVKIDYGNGSGSGNVLWRLGAGGDFTPVSNDSQPWFSHQHDIEFDGTNFELYDNGNTRVVQSGGGNSRGQVWSLDQTALKATNVLNADLGAFSPAVGSAQRLSNGNYQFVNGDLAQNSAPFAQAVEVLPNGAHDLSFSYSAFVYRVFRLFNLYTYSF